MKFNYPVNFGLVTVGLGFLQLISGWILGVPTDLTAFTLEMVALVLTIFVLILYVVNSDLSFKRLLLATFLIYCVIGNINIHIEALIFNVTDPAETLNKVIFHIFSAFIISFAVVWFFQETPDISEKVRFQKRSPVGWGWRIILGTFIYFVFYAVAGSILVAVYPELLNFYKDKIPPFHLIFMTQLVRGLIFAGIAVLILKTTRLSLLKQSVLTGLIFSVFGGIAPLIPPSEFMPAYVRFGHGFEVGLSNFLYGMLLGFLLGQKPENKEDFKAENV
jgi:hypothetical protein